MRVPLETLFPRKHCCAGPLSKPNVFHSKVIEVRTVSMYHICLWHCVLWFYIQVICIFTKGGYSYCMCRMKVLKTLSFWREGKKMIPLSDDRRSGWSNGWCRGLWTVQTKEKCSTLRWLIKQRFEVKTKEFTRLAYTGLVVELEHLKIKTRLTNEKFASVKGECEI